ncbi:multiple epidermal growth factor-like domains protein 10 [Argopecten irradians]|uniref:multiple epidermal growth factor-like domains protein 10 n=1 Tax=Argopecten irradians TaxID=31199 RepID=UPI003711C9E1
MKYTFVILCVAFASVYAEQACTTIADCQRCPPGTKGFCAQQVCHCHTNYTCTAPADCTTCQPSEKVTCDEEAPGIFFCHCDDKEAPPPMQTCTTADMCKECAHGFLTKVCHNGECQCHYDAECESSSDCYTCPHGVQSVTCEARKCYCDGHQAPAMAATCKSVRDCPRCPLSSMTQGCLNHQCYCHMPNECKLASDCTSCPPDVTTVTCDGDGNGDMFCRCDGHPPPFHHTHG